MSARDFINETLVPKLDPISVSYLISMTSAYLGSPRNNDPSSR